MIPRIAAAIDPRSLRTRLMIWNICAVAVVVGTLGAIVQVTIDRALRSGIDADLTKNVSTIMSQAHQFLIRDRDQAAGRAGPRRLDGSAGPVDPPPEGAGQPSPGGGAPPERAGGDGPAPRSGATERRGDRTPGPPTDRTLSAQSLKQLEEQRRQSFIPRIFNTEGVAMRPYQNAGAWDGPAVRRALGGEVVRGTVSVDGEALRVLTIPVRWRGEILGAVQVAHPLTDVRQAIGGVNQTLLTLVPLALLLAGLAGAIVTGRALQPVGQMADTADRIDGQDLSQRLAIVGTDEFARLARTVNRMLGRLEVAFGEQKGLVQQLEALLEQQKRFTADASHELKTPLAVAKVHTGLLLSTSPTEREVRDSAASIDDAVDRMSRLVQDLLLLARSDAGYSGRNPTSLIVQDLLEQARRLQSVGEGPSITIDEGPVLSVLGSEDELVRVFANLLANARRHTPADGTIRVTMAQVQDRVVIRIADSGEGIDPEYIPHLGERFYRIDSARSRGAGGAGLGLAICTSLLEAHGGSMRFESTPGRGTTVTVSLPAELDAEAPN